VRHLETQLKQYPTGDFSHIFQQYISYRATLLKNYKDDITSLPPPPPPPPSNLVQPSTLDSVAEEDHPSSGEEVKNEDEGPVSDPSLLRTGVGEEDEELLHEVRGKLFQLKENAYIDLGICIFKINQNCITQKKRILCRAEGTGKLLLNTYLYPSTINKHELGKKDVILVCLDSQGRPAKYFIRVKTPESAEALHNALNEYKK
jgi:hypothetical protein